MMYEQAQQLERQITVQHQVRPLRFAYIVDRSDESDIIFDAIFRESYQRWGGRRTLIVPSKDGAIAEEYTRWLEWYDPDILYTYADLTGDTVEALERVLLPTIFRKHESNRNADDAYWARPEHGVNAANCLTMVPLVRRSDAETLPCIMDAHFFGESDRFFGDNFGEIEHGGRDGLFTTITLKPKEANIKKRFESDQTARTTADLLEQISKNRSVLSLSQLSGRDTGIYRTSYIPAFRLGINLVIGDSFEDRLYFWNSRHFFDESNMLDFPAMRIPTEKLVEESFIAGLVMFLTSWSSMFPSDQGQPHIIVRSYSLDAQTLEDFIEKTKAFAKHLHIYVDQSKPLPIPEKLDDQPHFFQGYPHSDRVNESPFKVVPNEPRHFHYISPPFTSLKEGQYAVDLAIDRYNNHSRIINRAHWWQLPKRKEVARLFLEGRTRVTRHGTLSVVYSRFGDDAFRRDYTQENAIQLSFPEDKFFFGTILHNDRSYETGDLRNRGALPGYSKVVTSPKGRGLQAIVHTFGGLYPAFKFVDNRFWREAAEDMMAFKKTTSDEGKTETQIGHPKTITYEDLKVRRRKSFKEFKKTAQNGQGFHDEGILSEIVEDFGSTLQRLVADGVFFQGYRWTCPNCGNANWVTVQSFNLFAECEVCQHKQQTDVTDRRWEFKLNQRLGNALYGESVIAELWTLGHLLEQARETFYFIPQSELYRDWDNKNSDKEIDIVCVQDGNYIIGEAKYSASGFKDKDIDKLIALSKDIKPDAVILSYINNDKDISAMAEDIRRAGFRTLTTSPEGTQFDEYDPWSSV